MVYERHNPVHKNEFQLQFANILYYVGREHQKSFHGRYSIDSRLYMISANIHEYHE